MLNIVDANIVDAKKKKQVLNIVDAKTDKVVKGNDGQNTEVCAVRVANVLLMCC